MESSRESSRESSSEITQQEIVSLLKSHGYDIEIRTLTFWRSNNLLPQLERVGNSHFAHTDEIPRIKELCTRVGRGPEETLFTYEIEEMRFEITRLEIRQLERRTVAWLYIRDGGYLVKELRRGELDAFTGDREDNNT